MLTNLCLTDQSPLGDNRVLSSVRETGISSIINIMSVAVPSHPPRLLFIKILFLAFFSAIFKVKWRFFNTNTLFSGFKKSLNMLATAVSSGRSLSQLYANDTIYAIYAHDLHAMITAISINLPRSCRITYDSHEVQFSRNRKNGLLRSMLECGLEFIALHRADEAVFVNNRITNLMRAVYGKLPPSRVRSNDFYVHHPLPHPHKNVLPPAIVYVGKGTSGRGFELLNSSTAAKFFTVHMFLCGLPIPEKFENNFWNIGASDYKSELLGLVRSRRCVMWCYLEPTCLSYKLATPNKFYQALAVGMPIVASKNTYLAEIVSTNNSGYIFDDTGFDSLYTAITTDNYWNLVKNIGFFRERIKNNTLI